MATPRLDAERIALWRQLSVVVGGVQRAIDTELIDECELPLAHFDVLTALRDSGGSMRVGALRDALNDLPSSLSRRLDRMEDDGLVERVATPTPSDRRSVTVKITADGRTSWRDASLVYRRALQQHFARHLTETDTSSLQRISAKVTG